MALEAAYLSLHRTGELRRRADRLVARLADCDTCPRDCRVNRLAGALGSCAAGRRAQIASAVAHFGEEPGIAGTRGSGTVFFVNCNLKCRFCQNWQISQRAKDPRHRTMTPEALAAEMLRLEAEGCHNINWVSPSHVVPQAVEALAVAAERGLTVPVVYNTNAYDAVSVLRELDGVVDVYLPDFKYMSAEAGRAYSGVHRYPEIALAAVEEMVRQTGPVIEENGLVRRGTIVRHLVMPNDVADSVEVMRELGRRFAGRIWVSIMNQYTPMNAAARTELIDRPITAREYERVVDAALRFGLAAGYTQEAGARSYYRPDFDDRHAPFADARDFRPGLSAAPLYDEPPAPAAPA